MMFGMFRLMLVLLPALLAERTSFEVASIRAHPGAISLSADPSFRGNCVDGDGEHFGGYDRGRLGREVRSDLRRAEKDRLRSFRSHRQSGGRNSPITKAEFRLMLQSLLADRFQLKFHRETKEVPSYALVLLKDAS